jgi:dihydroneopterin aldolase
MMDRIVVEGIEFHGRHGVAAGEREVGNRFRVDLELELDLLPAGRSDDLALTVDYAEAARQVVEVGTGPSVQLIETLAERMAERLLAEFSAILAVEVRVTKLHPPSPVPFAAAAVRIRRGR